MKVSIEFECPNRTCNTIHEWPTCIEPGFPLYICPTCKAFMEFSPQYRSSRYRGLAEGLFSLESRFYYDYLDYTPQPVRDALEESLRCYRANAWTGCIALARKTVEIIASEVGGKGKTLYRMLQDINERALVAEEFVHWDHYIRNLGNLAVHYNPDKTAEYGKPEADCALAYAYEVSKRIFLRKRADEFETDGEKEAYLARIDDPHWYRRFGIEFVR